MTERNRLICLLTKIVPLPFKSIISIAEKLVEYGVTIPKKGHWIIRSSGSGSYANNWAECSECHVCGSPQWKVCPVCETRMFKHNAISIKEVDEIDFDYEAEDI